MDDDVIPQPLRIVKSPKSGHRGTNPRHDPPQIPIRRSSRRGSRVLSAISATSARTPPMNVNRDCLEVRKVRDTKAKSPRATSSHASSDRDTTYRSCSNHEDVNRGKAGVMSRFFRAFDSISRRSSSERGTETSHWPGPISYPMTPITAQGLAIASRESSGTSEVATPSATLQRSLPTSRTSSGILAPFDLPVAGVKMVAAAEVLRIGTEPVSLWTTVDIAADVKMDEPISPELALPLDIVLLLDNLPESPVVMLRQIANSAYTVASCLNRRLDRFAVCCVDDGAEGGLKVLLPLASHSLHVAKRTMDDLRYLQLREAKPEGYGLDKAVFQASDALLHCSNRDALCHIFLITAHSQTPYPLPHIDRRVGFHTVSPDPQFRFSNSQPHPGWHIFPDIDTSNAGTVEVALIGKITKVLRQLRTGTNPGIVTNLTVDLTPGQGCQIQSVLDETYCAALRPGEKWTISAQVRVPPASVEQMLGSGVSVEGVRMSDTIDRLMSQLQEMLKDTPGQSDPQTIMTASLLYKHSLLPESSTVEVSSSCGVVRVLRRDSGCIIGAPNEPEPAVGNPVALSPREEPIKQPWRDVEAESPIRLSTGELFFRNRLKAIDGRKWRSTLGSNRYSTDSFPGGWDTQKPEVQPPMLSNATNLSRDSSPYDPIWKASMGSGHSPESVPARKARFGQRYENIRQRIKTRDPPG
ncbi:hypothetical protein VTN02DRAFT_6543 [Thermoascus thermophilus]